MTNIGHWANELAVGAWNSFGVESAPQTSNIPTYKLDVLEGTLNQMQTALENGDSKLGHDDGGNKPYFKASLSLDDQEIQRAKICLRGSMPWHHDFAKPSLRIKIKKADHRGGARYVELTRPEDSLAAIHASRAHCRYGTGAISNV